MMTGASSAARGAADTLGATNDRAPGVTAMRLRDIGDAALCSAAGDAISVRAAVMVVEEGAGAAWGGLVWPYRPLALTPGLYTLRVRGEDIGQVTVYSVRVEGEREVGELTGEEPPGPLLRRLARSGRAAHPGRGPQFPRVAGEVEPTPLAVLAGAIGAGLGRVFARPGRRLSRR